MNNDMPMRKITESKIADALDDLARGNISFELGIRDFIARKFDGKWEVEFTYKNYSHCKLVTKYSNVRRFRLDGIEKWMIKMEIMKLTICL